jgi:hypothetical protein
MRTQIDKSKYGFGATPHDGGHVGRNNGSTDSSRQDLTQRFAILSLFQRIPYILLEISCRVVGQSGNFATHPASIRYSAYGRSVFRLEGSFHANRPYTRKSESSFRRNRACVPPDLDGSRENQRIVGKRGGPAHIPGGADGLDCEFDDSAVSRNPKNLSSYCPQRTILSLTTLALSRPVHGARFKPRTGRSRAGTVEPLGNLEYVAKVTRVFTYLSFPAQSRLNSCRLATQEK